MQPPGGWAADRPEPPARSVETFSDAGRPWTATWLDPPFRPDPPDCNQAYGVCFDLTGKIVLVRTEVDHWNLPGGGVELGETLEETLVREVAEEACGRVLAQTYIGCQRIDDPENPLGRQRYYQSRFWARVELLPWQARFEVTECKLVDPAEFLSVLSWGHAPTASIILEEGLRMNGMTPR